MIVLPKKLLAADEPAPVSVYNEGGKSPFLLVADHAGNLIPRALGRLGIAEGDCQRHIAWDIGIAGLGRLLANALDATLIQQNYSRLVIDCNRPLEATTSIADISENTPIPGNAGLSDCARQIRAHEIFRPYHDRIEAELDCSAAGRPGRGADLPTQLHARLQRRDAALACGRALQSRRAVRASRDGFAQSGK